MGALIEYCLSVCYTEPIIENKGVLSMKVVVIGAAGHIGTYLVPSGV